MERVDQLPTVNKMGADDQGFYTPFEKKFKSVEGTERVKNFDRGNNRECRLVARCYLSAARRLAILACSGFPKCKFKKHLSRSGLKCQKRGTNYIKKTRKGRKFYGCRTTRLHFCNWKLEDIKNVDCGV